MYSLSDKVSSYLASKNINGARIEGSQIVIPMDGGEFVREFSGLINKPKLDALAAEYKSEAQGI